MRREIDYIVAHTQAPTALMGAVSYSRNTCNTIGIRSCLPFHFDAAGRPPRAPRCGSSLRVQLSVAYQGRFSCVLSMGARSRARRELTDRICRTPANDNNPLTNRQQNLSATSTASASASAIWPSWLSRTRQKPTWRFSLASMRERLADGLRRTLSRLRTRSGSSSAKSCVDTTSAIKPRRRAF